MMCWRRDFRKSRSYLKTQRPNFKGLNCEVKWLVSRLVVDIYSIAITTESWLCYKMVLYTWKTYITAPLRRDWCCGQVMQPFWAKALSRVRDNLGLLYTSYIICSMPLFFSRRYFHLDGACGLSSPNQKSSFPSGSIKTEPGVTQAGRHWLRLWIGYVMWSRRSSPTTWANKRHS